VTCIRVYKRQSPKCALKDNKSFFAEAFVSHDSHTLSALEESGPPLDDLHLRVPVENPALLSLDLPLTALIGIAGRRRKILTCTRINKTTRAKFERLRSTRLIRRDLKATNSRHARLQVKQ
jgi:hypothetical protein